MALDFPGSPTNGQVFSNYIYDTSLPGWRNINTNQGVALQYSAGLVPVIPTSVNVGSGSATVGVSGMVSFTGSSSIRLNGCFTSSYRNYKILLDVTAASAIQSICIRYSSGGTDNTTADNYFAWGRARENGTAANGGTLNANYGFLVDTLTNGGISASVEVFKPQIAAETRYLSNHFGFDSASYAGYNGGIKAGLTSFDGINFYMAGGGTINGTLQVFGYR